MCENGEQDFARFQNMIIPCMKIRDSKSPPKAQVDEASLQQAMDRNKESLKVKLMNRRPINQLVEQGIIPSRKVPPHFHEQVQKLERAKTGDILKNKIQRRPDRQELIQQHILEDTKIDPSLQDKQRQLKKARLADDLNDRLSHRPGPLELVKGNILHADEKFAQAVKEGQIPFKRTCEGQALRHPAPSFIFEDDSGSDVALSPPQDSLDHSLSSMPSVETMVLSPYQNHESPTSSMGELRITTSTPPSSLSSSSSQPGSVPQIESTHKEIVATVRTRKKSKPKAQPKTRTIKFHEYKGPPSAQKSLALNAQEETSYELLLQQQQLFLQWQLEMQQKYPQIILPQPSVDQSKSMSSVQNTVVDQQQDVPRSPPHSSLSKFEDLKVNDLKAELKRRNLPVSGSKPQLIERLKNHIESNSELKPSDKCNRVETTTVPLNVSGIILDGLSTLVTQPDSMTSVVTMEASSTPPQLKMTDEAALMVYSTVPMSGQIVTSRPSSTAPMDIDMNSNVETMDCTENTNAMKENIVKLQQQRIQQLQMELLRSQEQVKHQQALLAATQHVPIAPAPPNRSTTVSLTNSMPLTSSVDPNNVQKQLQQCLQQKIQQQQLLQQLQQQSGGGKFTPGSPAMSAAVKANLAAFIHNHQANSLRSTNGIASLNQPYVDFKPIVLCPAQTLHAIVEKPRANSLPNGIGQQKLLWPSSVQNFTNVIAPKQPQLDAIESKFIVKKNPPDYSQATKFLNKVKQEKSQPCSKRNGRKSVKSQAVDDVLEILIQSGELPPSAAQEPPTPTTPETQKALSMAPTFPTVGTKLLPEETKCMDESQSINVSVKTEPPIANSESNHPIDFDLQYDLENIETMDLGDFGNTDSPECSSQCTLSYSELPQMITQQNNCPSSNGDVNMDLEWLDGLSNNNPLVSSVNQPRSFNFNNDPLLPNMSNGQDTSDMFSLDDFGYKAPSENILCWDKVDYAI